MHADRVLTIDEAARLRGVSVVTLRRRIREGKIPGARRASQHPNAAWLIPASDLGLPEADNHSVETEAVVAVGLPATPDLGPALAAAEARNEELRLLVAVLTEEVGHWQELAQGLVALLKPHIEASR